MRKSFPIRNPIDVDSDFSCEAKDVWNVLSPLLTDTRRKKMEAVASQRIFGCTVVLESLYDRGNVSAVFRSAEAFGLAHLHLVQNEKFKDSQRTSAGAEKWLEIQKWKTTSESIGQLKSAGKKIYVTALSATAKPVNEVDFTKPCAILFGNELKGASDEALAAADEHVIIPMRGFVQSFNISVASALAFQHIAREIGGDVSEEERQVLLATYAIRTLDSAPDILRRSLHG